MFLKDREFTKKVIIVSVAILVVAFIIYNFKFITEKIGYVFRVMSPFMIGLFLAYIFAMPLEFFEKKLKLKRMFSLAVIYIIFISLLGFALSYLVPMAIETSSNIAGELQKSQIGAKSFFKQFDLGPFEALITQNVNRISSILTNFSKTLFDGVTSMFAQITFTLINSILGIIISFYMLLDKEKIIAVFKRINDALFSDKRSDALEAFFQSVNDVFSHFLRGLMAEAVVVSVICYFALSMIGLRYTLLLSIMILVLYMIPTLGLVISMVPVVFSCLTYDPMKGFIALIVMVIIQQIDGNIIAPKLIGGFVGLDPFWILLSIMLFGALMGIYGVIFAIPFAVIVKTTAIKYIEKKEAEEALESNDVKAPHL